MWKVNLRYASPSEATDANGNLAPPWWVPQPSALETSEMVELPPSIPVSEPEKSRVEGEVDTSGEAPPSVDVRWCIVQALDGNRRRSWWHCIGCGKINQRAMLVHRRCSFCQVGMFFPFRLLRLMAFVPTVRRETKNRLRRLFSGRCYKTRRQCRTRSITLLEV